MIEACGSALTSLALIGVWLTFVGWIVKPPVAP
jgi:hypothetical protein